MQVMEPQATVQKGKGIVRGLCVECAVRHHDFKEILAHGEGDDHFSESPLPAAWIDGRRHRLLAAVGTQETKCGLCNRRAPAIYLPIGE